MKAISEAIFLLMWNLLLILYFQHLKSSDCLKQNSNAKYCLFKFQVSAAVGAIRKNTSVSFGLLHTGFYACSAGKKKQQTDLLAVETADTSINGKHSLRHKSVSRPTTSRNSFNGWLRLKKKRAWNCFLQLADLILVIGDIFKEPSIKAYISPQTSLPLY